MDGPVLLPLMSANDLERHHVRNHVRTLPPGQKTDIYIGLDVSLS